MGRVRSEVVVPVPIGVETPLQRAPAERKDRPPPPVLQCAELPLHLGVQLPSADPAVHVRCSERPHSLFEGPVELCAPVTAIRNRGAALTSRTTPCTTLSMSRVVAVPRIALNATSLRE